jgi:predicted enzyme related to lactoylglutathione lyase
MYYVKDLESGATFYEEVFGLRRCWQRDDAIGMKMPDTDTEIVLHTNSSIYYQVHYLVDNVLVAVDALKCSGCTVVVEPFDIEIGRCAVVKDPFGIDLPILDLNKSFH